jgi:hypothetical protein
MGATINSMVAGDDLRSGELESWIHTNQWGEDGKGMKGASPLKIVVGTWEERGSSLSTD